MLDSTFCLLYVILEDDSLLCGGRWGREGEKGTETIKPEA